MELYLLFLLIVTIKADWDYAHWKNAWKSLDWKKQMMLSEEEEARCFSCTSIDASEIVGGAGVHPGVYLTSILLASIPVTNQCYNPARLKSAPICDDGLCVKINYTAKATGRMDVLRACLPRSKGVFKQVCTEFASSQAEGIWCVCSGDRCNSAPSLTFAFTSILPLSVAALQYFFQ